ncbi:MAG: hypothetical protein U1E17_04700 [Geminicoccaceae bacterium]
MPSTSWPRRAAATRIPTLPDFIRRDLRLVPGAGNISSSWAHGLHAMGRLQLLLAMLMYLSEAGLGAVRWWASRPPCWPRRPGPAASA